MRVCQTMDWYQNWEPETCRNADGEILSKAEYDNKWPEGSYCQNECDLGYAHEIWQWDKATCKCDESGCKFDTKKVNRCLAATCNPSIEFLKSQFADGIFGEFVNEHDVSDVSPIVPNVEHFASLDCPAESYWSGTGDINLDGMVKYDTTCEIKCIEGFHIERDDAFTRCGQSFDHDFQWGVISGTISRYGECYNYVDAMYSCADFPICVPDGFTWRQIVE